MAEPTDFFNELSMPPAQAIPPEVKRVPVTKQDNPADFFQTLEPPPPEGPQYGGLETAARHGFQGVTMGFGDELKGLAAASGKEHSLPIPTDIAHGLARLGWQKLTGGTDASEAYTKARDEDRQTLEQSHIQHPIIGTGADVLGSMAVPGGSMLKGATMGARALRGAGLGILQGGARGAGDAPEMEDVPKSTATGSIIGGVLGGPMNAVLGPRVMSPARKALMDVADKYGVQLPHYMVSDSPIVQFYGKGMDQLPFVGGAITRAGDKAKAGIKDIRDEFVDSATGLSGTAPTEAREIASTAATKARDQFVEDAKKVSTQNYDDITNLMANPRARISPSNLQNEIADQAAKLTTYAGDAGPILRQAHEAAQMQGGMTYEGMKNLRTRLYNKWKTMEGRSDTDRADYIGIIGAVSKDMEDVINKAGGPRAVAAWKKANVQHGAGKDMAEELGTAIGKGTGDTSAADAIFRNVGATRPNISEINTLRNTMRPADWDKVQASVVARMGADDAGNFSMQKFISANNKMADAGRDALFGMAGTPRRDAYDAILKLGQSVQNVERFNNASKTAPVLLGAGAALQAYNDFREGSYLRTPMELGAGLTLAAILARPATARSATRFANAMDKYINNPTAWAAGKVPQAVEVAARNFAISLANSSGLDKDKLVNSFIAPTPIWEQK